MTGWPGPSPLMPRGSHHVPIRGGEERLGGETASRLQTKSRLYPGEWDRSAQSLSFLYIWKLRGTEAFIPGIPKLEWVSGYRLSAARGQKVPLTNRAAVPHQAPPKPSEERKRGDLPTPGPVSSVSVTTWRRQTSWAFRITSTRRPRLGVPLPSLLSMAPSGIIVRTNLGSPLNPRPPGACSQNLGSLLQGFHHCGDCTLQESPHLICPLTLCWKLWIK